MAGLFTFCTPEFQQSVGRGTQATKGPTNSSARSNEKEEAPTGGTGLLRFLWEEQGDGREAVTGSCLALGELRTTPSIMNIL